MIDFEPSLSRHGNWSVNEILATQLPVSVLLGLTSILLACVIGIGAGAGAVRQGTWLDYCTLLIALIGISLPPS